MLNSNPHNHHLIDPNGHTLLSGQQFVSNNPNDIVDEAAMIFGAESGDYSFFADYSTSPTMTSTPATNSSISPHNSQTSIKYEDPNSVGGGSRHNDFYSPSPSSILVENNNNLEQSNYYSTSFETLTMHPAPINSTTNGRINNHHQTLVSSTPPTNLSWGATTVTANQVNINNQELLKAPVSQSHEGSIGNKRLLMLPTQPANLHHHPPNVMGLNTPGSMEHTFNPSQQLPPPPPLMIGQPHQLQQNDNNIKSLSNNSIFFANVNRSYRNNQDELGYIILRKSCA